MLHMKCETCDTVTNAQAEGKAAGFNNPREFRFNILRTSVAWKYGAILRSVRKSTQVDDSCQNCATSARIVCFVTHRLQRQSRKSHTRKVTSCFSQRSYSLLLTSPVTSFLNRRAYNVGSEAKGQNTKSNELPWFIQSPTNDCIQSWLLYEAHWNKWISPTSFHIRLSYNRSA